jgi:hypothetical protein
MVRLASELPLHDPGGSEVPMATLVLLLHDGQSQFVLRPDAARELRRLGVITTTLVQGNDRAALVLSGWDFDAAGHGPTVCALVGPADPESLLVEVADVALTS